MTEETAASGDWFERTLFVIALVVFLFLGATGPWRAAGPAGTGGCPVENDQRYVPTGDVVEAPGDLERGVVYVTRLPAHTDERRCLGRTLAAGERVEVGGADLSVDGDGSVRVGDDRVPPDQTWISRTESVSVLDPWYTYERDVILVNAGRIEGVRTDDGTRRIDRQVVLVTGSVSRTAQLNFTVVGLFVAASLVLIGIGLEWSVRYSRADLLEETEA